MDFGPPSSGLCVFSHCWHYSLAFIFMDSIGTVAIFVGIAFAIFINMNKENKSLQTVRNIILFVFIAGAALFVIGSFFS